MTIMGLKELRKINTCFRIFFFFERVRDWILAESEIAWELVGREVLRDKSHALPVSSLHRVMGQGTPPFVSTIHNWDSSFYNKAFDSLGTFSVLVIFFLKRFHDGLRMQGRKAFKRAFHFRDRGKNAWL